MNNGWWSQVEEDFQALEDLKMDNNNNNRTISVIFIQ